MEASYKFIETYKPLKVRLTIINIHTYTANSYYDQLLQLIAKLLQQTSWTVETHNWFFCAWTERKGMLRKEGGDNQIHRGNQLWFPRLFAICCNYTTRNSWSLQGTQSLYYGNCQGCLTACVAPLMQFVGIYLWKTNLHSKWTYPCS